MKLTGKAKQDFEQWCEDQLYDRFISQHHLSELDETCLNALIIEFFDFIGIYINVLKYEEKWKIIVNTQFKYTFESRQEAITEAIIKANELYNRE